MTPTPTTETPYPTKPCRAKKKAMMKRYLIGAGLIVVLVVLTVVVSDPHLPARGPNKSDACGSSERFVVEPNYIGCTRGGQILVIGEGDSFVSWGNDGRGGHEDYWSNRVDWWEKITCLVGVGLCPRWVGELTPEEVAKAREYFGLIDE